MVRTSQSLTPYGAKAVYFVVSKLVRLVSFLVVLHLFDLKTQATCYPILDF